MTIKGRSLSHYGITLHQTHRGKGGFGLGSSALVTEYGQVVSGGSQFECFESSRGELRKADSQI